VPTDGLDAPSEFEDHYSSRTGRSHRVTTYRLDSYGPPREDIEVEGLFQLTDVSWHLLFDGSQSGVSCGLLRSDIEVEATGPRRCRVTVGEKGDSQFQASFVVRADADDLQADLSNRRASLDRAADVIAAVEAGEWWKDSRVFDSLGPSRTRSVAGVRSLGGKWGTRRIKATRHARVMDFGPRGVSLRGWMTPLVIPWMSIARIEVTDDTETAGTGWDRTTEGASIILHSLSGQQVAFRTVLAAAPEVRASLEPLITCATNASGNVSRPISPASMAIGPIAVPELSS
jgi:hypothetical protein